MTKAVVAADALPSITCIYMQHVAMLLNILLDTTFVPSTEEERTHVAGMPSRTRMCHRRWLQRMRYLNRNIRFCQKNVRTHHLNHSESCTLFLDLRRASHELARDDYPLPLPLPLLPALRKLGASRASFARCFTSLSSRRCCPRTAVLSPPQPTTVETVSTRLLA